MPVEANCGDCIKYDSKNKRCLRDGSYKMKVNGCYLYYIPKAKYGNPESD